MIGMLMRRLGLFLFLLFLSCAGPGESVPKHDATRESDLPPLQSIGDFPETAFDLLNESIAESCAVCVRDLRRDAFDLLDDHYRPGGLFEAGGEVRLVRPPNRPGEMVLRRNPHEGPALTFRFHTRDDHLVGVAASDWTDETVARLVHSVPEGEAVRCVLEIVSFAYGDGAAFLYNSSENSLQVHCKVLEVSGPASAPG